MESSRQKDIYYEYLCLNNLDVKYHLVNIDRESYCFLIPTRYNISYLKSVSNYDGMGHIHFFSEKNKYSLDYIKEDNQTFKYYLDMLNKKVSKHFTNYLGGEFFEVLKDKADSIYMYFQGYMFHLASKNKLDINEYFDMYFILFSVTNTIIHNNLALLKGLTILLDHGVYAFCNDEDILTMNLNQYINDIDLKEEYISVNSDDAYLKYKEKQRQADIIGHNVLMHQGDDNFSITSINDTWSFSGTFFFGCLGYYQKGAIVNYDEITESDELTFEEKVHMLDTIIKQKQMEVDSHEDLIKDAVYNYLVSYIVQSLNYSLWDKTHFKEFIHANVLMIDYEEVSDVDLYQAFIDYLNNHSDYEALLDYKKISNSAIGEEMTIYPDGFAITFSLCNYALDNITLKIDDEYLIKS